MIKTKAPKQKNIKQTFQRKQKADKPERIEAPYPHFRYYNRNKHPALIVGEEKVKKEEYKYRKVSHSERDGRHLNEKIEPNPNPKDKKPMYIGKRVRHDDKNNFEKRPLPWKVPKHLKKKK